MACGLSAKFFRWHLGVLFLLITSFNVNAENDTDWRVVISGKVVNMNDKSARDASGFANS